MDKTTFYRHDIILGRDAEKEVKRLYGMNDTFFIGYFKGSRSVSITPRMAFLTDKLLTFKEVQKIWEGTKGIKEYIGDYKKEIVLPNNFKLL
jgi:hypothetical protein